MTTEAPTFVKLRAPAFTAARTLEVVDSHTCGQPTRVILSGAGLPAGMDPDAARRELEASRDWVRRVSVMEPRGHRSMFVAALIAPDPEVGEWGVVYMDAMSYPDMCGHATIGVATTLVEMGLVPLPAPDHTGEIEIGLHTPAGRIALRVTLEDGRCVSVAFRTPYAFYLGAVEIALPDGGTASVDVAYGGQWYAFLPAKAAGLDVEPDMIDRLIAAAGPVRAALNAALDRVDPRDGLKPQVGNIVWLGSHATKGASARNVPVSRTGSFDRSPCGTATCARLACLVAKGELGVGETFVNQGLMETLYQGQAVSRYTDDRFDGIVPEVTGRAWLTAVSQLMVDETDPLGDGYLVGGGEAVS
ncbi:proline racemase family protein [Psychromarinibacter sp. S121]|uniref:proline racemase family protein n=1 Tax=Psychromarinibacter sp. S121 TaxID=3415127 RepID=UPI003C7A3ED0